MVDDWQDMARRGEVPAGMQPAGDIDWALLEYLQTLTPTQRIIRNEQALELVQALREAGMKHYGFDPGSGEKVG